MTKGRNVMGIGDFVILSTFSVASLVALPIVLHFRAERRKRELDHIERMRAIEVGRSYPGELKNSLLAFPHWAVPHLLAIGIGVAVPLGVFLFAFLTTLISGFQKEVWIASCMVGLGAVICGTVLAGSTFKPAAGHESEHAGSYVDSKPLVDEDANDVVSSRG
jgi:hypothetical protein